MTRNDVYARLHLIFQDILGTGQITLTDETTAQDVDGWDSLNHVNLIVAVERSFRVSFTTRDAKKLRNVGDLVDLIVSKAPQEPGAKA
jgi:acyl carrier protein